MLVVRHVSKVGLLKRREGNIGTVQRKVRLNSFKGIAKPEDRDKEKRGADECAC